jgi:hypothetical protein
MNEAIIGIVGAFIGLTTSLAAFLSSVVGWSFVLSLPIATGGILALDAAAVVIDQALCRHGRSRSPISLSVGKRIDSEAPSTLLADIPIGVPAGRPTRSEPARSAFGQLGVGYR